MTKTARLMGCVAAAWLFGASVGNAAVLTEIGTGGAVTFAPIISNPQNLFGTATSGSALSFTTDFLEFSVAPDANGLVIVNVLNDPASGNPSFPNETFRIVRDTTGGALVLAATAASNASVPVLLLTGVNYFLELSSSAPLAPGGISSLHVQVPLVPIPGAALLFGTVLGAGGLLMRRRRNGGAAAV